MDLDGTLIEQGWPELGEWKRDAQWAMNALRDAGHHPYLYTARLAPTWPDGRPRTAADVYRDSEEVARLLDGGGLGWMDVWVGEGKPHWDVLVDDKVIWYPGRPGSWKKLVPTILKRVGDGGSFDAIMAEAGRREESE